MALTDRHGFRHWCLPTHWRVAVLTRKASCALSSLSTPSIHPQYTINAPSIQPHNLTTSIPNTNHHSTTPISLSPPGDGSICLRAAFAQPRRSIAVSGQIPRSRRRLPLLSHDGSVTCRPGTASPARSLGPSAGRRGFARRGSAGETGSFSTTFPFPLPSPFLARIYLPPHPPTPTRLRTGHSLSLSPLLLFLSLCLLLSDCLYSHNLSF